MSAVDCASGANPEAFLEGRSCMTARVTTTVVLPPDALTIVAPQPEMISQINVEQVLGLPARIYLELLREPGCPISVISVGKLRLVDRHQFRRWLEVRGKAQRARAAKESSASDVDDAGTVEELDRLGFKPVPPADRR